jgi:hypothetical protein
MTIKRDDLEALVRDIKENPFKRKRDLVKEHTTVCTKYPNFVDEYLRLVQEDNLTDLSYGTVHNVWICGKTGTGKSKTVRDISKRDGRELYVKSHDRWWDDYDHEPDVLIKDVGTDFFKTKVALLKLWADVYPFLADRKNRRGRMMIRPKRIFVTSNYTIAEIFREEDVAQLERRFKYMEPLTISGEETVDD